MCRIGDLRKGHIIVASVHMYVIKPRYTEEGEIIPYDLIELTVSNAQNCLLFLPTIVEHKISEESPLYRLLKTDRNGFNTEEFEVLVTLEGKLLVSILFSDI